MNDFEGLLSSDYGFKPQGKAAPMASFKSNSSSKTSSFLDDHDTDTTFRANPKPSTGDFSDLGHFFSNKPNNSSSVKGSNNVDFDSFFGGGGGDLGPKFSSLPVFDKPVYDDEVSTSEKYDDIFSSKKRGGGGGAGDAFDDLLGGLGKTEKKEPQSVRSGGGSVGGGGGSKAYEKSSIPSFDDLLPGFGSGRGSAGSINRNPSDAGKKTSSATDDPFVVLESTSPPVSSSPRIFIDPLEEININNSGKRNTEKSSGSVFDDIDPLAGFANPVPAFSAEINAGENVSNPFAAGAKVSGRQTSVGGDASQISGRQTSVGGDASQKSSVRSPERVSEKKTRGEDYSEPSIFEVPSMPAETSRFVPNVSSPVHNSSSFRESNSHGHASPSSEENMGSFDDIWLTVSEVPLFTQPTAAPPPSRPPPPRPAHFSKTESGSFPASNVHKKFNDFPGYVPDFQSPKSATSGVKGSFDPLDGLEEFAMGRNRSDEDKTSDAQSSEDFDSNSVAAASAAAMKEAMERAEAKFRYARGVRERENAKASRSRDSVQVEKDETPRFEGPERDFREQQERMEREQQQREREEEEKRQREEEERRRIEKEREEKEREKRRVERERELARQAVERVAKEARERAAVEARARAERFAVQRAQAEARERAERAAVQRAQAEARERAAAGAKERAEKAAAEAREKAKSEAREKEVREREAREKEARERAASAARANQQKNDNDLESFFGMASRASSAPRPRATSSDPFGTDQFQSKPAPEATRTSANSSSSMRKASSSTNIVDDLSSIFGGPPSSNDFQEFEGETEDRRRARMERHQRTQERAAKALAEKNARDLEAQREQAERSRISETLDVEIRRWAAGKEGNLRALLSTLHYVLWPECGWQPVSLTDLITGAAVKKVYRKATLCIHPDKVQQKGATLQQKYVAEKVFDLLKEAWNKFNSEELF